MEVPGVATIALEILAEVQYKIVDGAGSGIHIVAPYHLEYMLPGYHLTLMFDEQFEQCPFLFTQFLYLALLIHCLMG